MLHVDHPLGDLASTLYHRRCCSKLLFMSSRANSIAVDGLSEAHLQLQIMTVDFNQRCLKTPKFVQCIESSTRGINNLDCVYSNLKHTYKAIRVCQPSFTAYAPLRRLQPGQKGLCHSWRMDSLTHKGFFSVMLSSLFHVDTICKHICKHSTLQSYTNNLLKAQTIT